MYVWNIDESYGIPFPFLNRKENSSDKGLVYIPIGEPVIKDLKRKLFRISCEKHCFVSYIHTLRLVRPG